MIITEEMVDVAALTYEHSYIDDDKSMREAIRDAIVAALLWSPQGTSEVGQDG